MGVKGFSSNRKKNDKKRDKPNKWRRAVKAEKKKNLPVKTQDIEDLHLYSKEKLQNKLKNPLNNIKISGKKKRRLTKRLGHALKEKSKMDLEVEEPTTIKRNTRFQQDVVMANETPEEVATTSAQTMDAEVPSGASGSSGKKRKNRKKKKSGGASKTSAESGKAAGGADGWEDVEMEEDL